MSKLIITLLLCAFIFGIAVFIFLGDGGMVEDLEDGHTQITSTVRGFDYSTN